jgi:hypothetical protein
MKKREKRNIAFSFSQWNRRSKICLFAICLVIAAFILIEVYALGFFTTDDFLNEIQKRRRAHWREGEISITDIVEKYIPKGSKKELALNFLKERKFSIYPQPRERWGKDKIGKFDEIIICSKGTMHWLWFLTAGDEIRIVVYIKGNIIAEVWGKIFLHSL